MPGARLRIVTPQGDIAARAAHRRGAGELIADARRCASRRPCRRSAMPPPGCRSASPTSCSCALDRPDDLPRRRACSARSTGPTTGSYHLRPFGRPVIECYFGGDARLASSSARATAPSRATRSSSSPALLGADVAKRLHADRRQRLGPRSVRARLLFLCHAGAFRRGRRSRRRSTTACSSPARPARSTTTRPRTAPIAPASRRLRASSARCRARPLSGRKSDLADKAFGRQSNRAWPPSCQSSAG